MNNYEKIYWLTRLDEFTGLLGFIAVMCAFVLIGYGIGYLIAKDSFYNSQDEADKFAEKYAKRRNLAFYILIAVLTLDVIIPSKNDAMMIIAGGATMNYIQSDSSLQKLPHQATEIISGYMDKKIDELEADKK